VSEPDDAQRTSAGTPVARPSSLVAHTVSHAQRLVDSRPPGPYQLEWCQEALSIGDFTALAAAALHEAIPTNSGT
jgi:hypothetical protein